MALLLQKAKGSNSEDKAFQVVCSCFFLLEQAKPSVVFVSSAYLYMRAA